MRNSIKKIIQAELAQYGQVTQKAMRLYCESGISFKVFQEQIKIGLKIYEKRGNDGTKCI